ncbi:thiamine pyrophosphate-dependent enzyme, partial [Mobilitalea sibirica]|uniref:hypothetical protein n=1 Tax=Mobilitalea sibirica TaxID=1462919 RepID=UPI001FB144FC
FCCTQGWRNLPMHKFRVKIFAFSMFKGTYFFISVFHTKLYTTISHGIKEGMGRSMATIKKAVQAGYWHLYRYNPTLKEQGKNPFILDSKEPSESFRDFIMGQIRYSALEKTFPEQAEELFKQAERLARERYEIYKQIAQQEPITV